MNPCGELRCKSWNAKTSFSKKSEEPEKELRCSRSRLTNFVFQFPK